MSTGTFGETLGKEPDWREGERPPVAGIPSAPPISIATRCAFASVGLLVAITVGLGSSYVNVLLPQVEGQYGLTPSQGAWVTAAYLFGNLPSNLLLFKARQHIGLRSFALAGASAYILIIAAHALVDTFDELFAVQMVLGFVTTPLITISVIYMRQALVPMYMWRGLLIGLGLTQLGMPLAGIIAPPLLNIGDHNVFYIFQGGLALCSLAALLTLRLPPSTRQRLLEAKDFLTFALLAPAFALLVAVLTHGTIEWWTNARWMAFALIGAIILITGAVVNEICRENQLLKLGWLWSWQSIRFAATAIILRIIASGQEVGAIKLQRVLGQSSDQLQGLYAVILLGQIIGVAASALTLNSKRLIAQVTVATVFIAVASLLSRNDTSMIRPHNIMLPQLLLSIGLGMFLGPLLVANNTRAFMKGPDHIVSAVILFVICQGMGTLIGTAGFGTYEHFRQNAYSTLIAADIDPTDPVVANRLRGQSSPYTSTITDIGVRKAAGGAVLARSVQTEAVVRAHNDIFSIVGLIGAAMLAWLSLIGRVRAKAVKGQKGETI